MRSCLKAFLFLALGPPCVVEWNDSSNLEEVRSSKTPVKLFQNPSIRLGGEVIKRFFYF